jgi:protein SCO1/2
MVKRRTGLALALIAATAAALLAVRGAPRPAPADAGHASLAVLDETVLMVEPPVAADWPALAGTDGATLGRQALDGRWSLVFFGFTSCPDVCPTTLQALSAMARAAGSAVADGSARIVFVSVDPERDTPQRMRSYLSGFDPRIVGATGSPQSLRAFTAAAGAHFEASASGFDHSTSLFVLDPRARLAAVILRPADPARIAADLAAVRRSHDARSEARR